MDRDRQQWKNRYTETGSNKTSTKNTYLAKYLNSSPRIPPSVFCLTNPSNYPSSRRVGFCSPSKDIIEQSNEDIKKRRRQGLRRFIKLSSKGSGLAFWMQRSIFWDQHPFRYSPFYNSSQSLPPLGNGTISTKQNSGGTGQRCVWRSLDNRGYFENMNCVIMVRYHVWVKKIGSLYIYICPPILHELFLTPMVQWLIISTYAEKIDLSLWCENSSTYSSTCPCLTIPD